MAPPDSLLEPKPAEPAAAPPRVADLMPEDPAEAGIKTEKGKADYRKWRQHQLSLEKRADELEAKLGQSPPATDREQAAAARIAELEGHLAEMSGEFEKIDIQRHPAFQRQFVQPRTEAFEAASTLLKDVEMEPALLDKALSLNGKARIQALDEITESIESPNVRMRLINHIDRIEQLDQARNAAMTDVKGQVQRMEGHERAERHRALQEQERQLLTNVDMAADNLKQNGFGMFLTEIPGNDKHNEEVRRIIADAKGVFTQNTNAEQLAAVAVMGRVAPKALAWAIHERQARLTVEKELAELKGARPGLEGEGTGAETGEAVEGISAAFARAKEGSGRFTV